MGIGLKVNTCRWSPSAWGSPWTTVIYIFSRMRSFMQEGFSLARGCYLRTLRPDRQGRVLYCHHPGGRCRHLAVLALQFQADMGVLLALHVHLQHDRRAMLLLPALARLRCWPGDLAQRLVEAPWRIMITCIDTHHLSESLLGQSIDEDFLKALPAGVDPCGENGEFHSFVCDGPGFARPIEVVPGERVLVHEHYLMIDLEPA
jgi:hypothetical protein